MTDHQIELVLRIAALCAIGAFWPQIRAWLHRIGYRDWRDRE